MKDYRLFDMFIDHQGRQIDKWEHYFPIYEKHFEKFRDTNVRVLEIGVDHGGSLQLWKRYFGRYATIIGVDNRPEVLFAEPQITTHQYDQCDPRIAELGPFDIVIDDGSHVKAHQERTFANLWHHTRRIYLIEDCHDGYPNLQGVGPAVSYGYHSVGVLERERRMIRGTPARELRPDEVEARKLYG